MNCPEAVTANRNTAKVAAPRPCCSNVIHFLRNMNNSSARNFPGPQPCIATTGFSELARRPRSRHVQTRGHAKYTGNP
jgi:hypothetical protein